jgi:hypothetical protein
VLTTSTVVERQRGQAAGRSVVLRVSASVIREGP